MKYLFGVGLVLLAGCRQADSDHHGHDHAEGAADHAKEPPSTSFTRWTDRYELFVELTLPVAAKPVAYHAHVTRLSDFSAVTKGTFRVRFKTPAGIARESVHSGVKRPGIFVFEGPAPAAGKYSLEMIYEHAGSSDAFDCGPIDVSNETPKQEDEAKGALITFWKESQWKIPFATAWAERRPVARELEIAAVVEPAGGDQLTIASPTGGRFYHNPKLALAEGLRVAKGDTIGTIAPTVAGDDYSRLESAVEEARIARDQAQREIARIEPLVRDNLLPERRLIELRNELENQTARSRSASARLGRVVAPGGSAGLVIQSSLQGVLSEVLVPNGEPVEAGAPLVRLGGTDHLWIRARFVAKPAAELARATPTMVRLASGERVDLERLGARFLSPFPVVDTATRIATWIVDVPRAAAGSEANTLTTDFRPGAALVLGIRVGEPETATVVPRDAVIEINTRPFVFVQVDGEHFEKRAVTLGAADGAWIRVESGVAERERVVTKAAFDIHLASVMGTVESHRH